MRRPPTRKPGVQYRVFEGRPPWFVASDVCRVLGLSNPTMALRALDDDEHSLSPVETVAPDGRFTGRKDDTLRLARAGSGCACILKAQLPGDRQARRHVFLPLNRVNFWLATIESGQVNDAEVKGTIIAPWRAVMVGAGISVALQRPR